MFYVVGCEVRRHARVRQLVCFQPFHHEREAPVARRTLLRRILKLAIVGKTTAGDHQNLVPPLAQSCCETVLHGSVVPHEMAVDKNAFGVRTRPSRFHARRPSHPCNTPELSLDDHFRMRLVNAIQPSSDPTYKSFSQSTGYSPQDVSHLKQAFGKAS
jgi:hypothetical protein